MVAHPPITQREALLAEQFSNPAFLVERYSAAVRTGFELAARRAQAVSEFWAAVPGLREPQDVVALQSAYWRCALDDYSAAMSGVVTTPPSVASKAEVATAA